MRRLSPLPPAFDASGAFETCRVMEGRVVHWADHLGRLKASLKTLGMREMGLEEVGVLADRLGSAARRVKEGFVRVAVRRPEEEGDRWLIHEHPGFPYSKRQIARGISVVTAPTRGPAGDLAAAQAKGSERLNGILARMEGRGVCPEPRASGGRRAFEVLRFGIHGYLTEGTASNLFLVKEGILATPPLWLGVLGGVTRGLVLKYANNFRIKHVERPITRHDLFNADEAFLTNVLAGILPVREADGRRIGNRVPGPITQRLWKAMRKTG